MAPLKAELEAENADLRMKLAKSTTLGEALSSVMAMLKREDKHWVKVFGQADDGGLEISDLQEWSEKIRNSVVGAPWIGRGLRLRHAQVWQGGIEYEGISTETRGRGPKVQSIIDNPLNQRNFFGKQARKRREGCLYHDGIALWIGDEATKTLQAIPLSQITDVLTDPDNTGEVWAYRRMWQQRNLETGKSERQVRWYFTDLYVDKRSATIQLTAGNPEAVDQEHVIFDMHANRLEGFSLGAPDALAAQIWNGIARDAVMDGTIMNSALATIAFRATSATQAGADNTTMRIAGAAKGATAVTGSADGLTAMPTAGKAYDFDALRGLTAIVATSLDVSNIALTSDVGAAGSSYNSASSLDLPTRLIVEARRDEHIELDERVLAWMGAPQATARFNSLDDATDIFRLVQALGLFWQSGLAIPEPIAERIADLLQVDANKVPDGVITPNNERGLWLVSPDQTADPNPQSGAGQGNPNGTSPTQGQASGVGKGVKPNDIRSDAQERFNAMLQAFIASEEQFQRGKNAA